MSKDKDTKKKTKKVDEDEDEDEDEEEEEEEETEEEEDEDEEEEKPKKERSAKQIKADKERMDKVRAARGTAEPLNKIPGTIIPKKSSRCWRW